MKVSWDKILLFTFSICLIVGLVYLVLLKPSMTEQQWFICISVLAFGGAGFAAFLPGSLEWEVKPGLKAAGSFAVLLLVFWFGRSVKPPHGAIKEWLLRPPPVDSNAPAFGIDTAAVYVYLDDQIVKAFGSGPNWLPVNPSANSAGINIERDVGSIKISVEGAQEGMRLFFIVHDENKWWISRDVRVPPAYTMSLDPTTEAVIRNRIQ